MNCSATSGSSSNEQQPLLGTNADIDEEKDSDICSLTCLVSNCLCTAGYSMAKSSSLSSQPFLRSSVFSNVPPTVRFYVKGSKVTKPSKTIRKMLTWCRNSLLPLVMRQSLATSYFTIVDESATWVGYWGKHLKSAQYQRIEPFQKVNHFPGAFHMGRKDRLWQHINEMVSIWGEDEYQIMPTTYVLPKEMKKLRAYLHNNTSRNVILKPPASARGAGISIACKIRQVPEKTSLIAQHYIERPLIINSAKFDLRLYVYVTCLDPIRIYLYNDGLVRFASVPYSSAPSSLSNKFMHLTNYSINKLAQSAGESTTAVPKWKLSDFWSHVADRIDVDYVKQQIEDVIIKAVLACENHIRMHQKKHSLYTFTSHELYGMDILLDDTLRPWLLEINISPSLHCATITDTEVKTKLARDVLNLCGVHIPPNPMNTKNGFLGIDYKVKPCDATKTEMDLKKEHLYIDIYQRTKDIDPTIVDNLTSSDARMLIDFEDEINRACNFDLLFPTAEKYDYVRFYNDPISYGNLLLARWQVEQAERGRQVGIDILEGIASRKEHMTLARISNHISHRDGVLA